MACLQGCIPNPCSQHVRRAVRAASLPAHHLPLPTIPPCLQIVAFIRGWDLSLVVLAAIPALIIAGGVCGVFTAKLQVG